MRKTSIALACALVCLVAAPGARAQTDPTFLSFVSDPGDYIGQGESRFFSPDTASFTSSSSTDNNSMQVMIFPFDGGFWFLHLAAPAGQPLNVGVYDGATRWPFQAPGVPGLDVSGDGRGCNMLTGRFEVLDAKFGPAGYIERFRATFEQHCEGAAAALRGEVQITNPPPPPILEISAVLSSKGRANRLTGAATLSGTVSCSTPTTVSLFGVVHQRANRFSLATGNFSVSVPCSTTPAPWSASVIPQGDVPFGAGMVSVDVTANGFDPNYGTFIGEQFTTAVRLSQSGH